MSAALHAIIAVNFRPVGIVILSEMIGVRFAFKTAQRE
jgi:hypothetical protein